MPPQKRKRVEKKDFSSSKATRANYTNYIRKQEEEQFASDSDLSGDASDNDGNESSEADEMDNYTGQKHYSRADKLVNVKKGAHDKDVYFPEQLLPILKPHQREGVRFIWQNTVMPPDESLCGCILAHSMGLGKTFQVFTFLYMYWNHYPGTRMLIIVPKVVLANWKNEVAHWKMKASLQNVPRVTSLDDGVAKDDRLAQVRKWYETAHGLLLIGYEMFTLLVSGKERKGAPNSEQLEEFQRYLRDPGPEIVVLDEGHRVKSPQALVTKQLSLIRTRKRVVLTGYPLQNHLMEYWCMVNWIRPGYWDQEEFKNEYVQYIQAGQSKDSNVDQVKEMKNRLYMLTEDLKGFVQRMDVSILEKTLLPKTEFIVTIRLTRLQKKLYKAFDKYQREQAFNTLKVTCMMQKICNHPDVVRQHFVKARRKMEESSLDYLKKPRKNAKKKPPSIANIDNIPDDEDELDDELDEADPKKPKKKGKKGGDDEDQEEDTEDVDIGDLDTVNFNEKDLMDSKQSWAAPVFAEDYRMHLPSNGGKMTALFQIIDFCVTKDDPEKVLVFSQYTETLEVIEKLLEAQQVPGFAHNWRKDTDYLRLDGGNSVKHRQMMIELFNRSIGAPPWVFLISTRAGGIGINLTSASRVVVFDVCWNPCHDNQAIFRAYRYGQRRAVKIYRLVAQGTAEEKIFKKQLQKIWLFNRVVDDKAVVRGIGSDDQNMFTLDEEDEESAEVDVEAADQEDPDVLGKVVQDCGDLIASCKTHDSLFKEDDKDKLTEEEKKNAERDYGYLKSLKGKENREGDLNKTAAEEKAQRLKKTKKKKDEFSKKVNDGKKQVFEQYGDIVETEEDLLMLLNELHSDEEGDTVQSVVADVEGQTFIRTPMLPPSMDGYIPGLSAPPVDYKKDIGDMVESAGDLDW